MTWCTEKEATQKWCPHARVQSMHCEAVVNRPRHAKHIGSVIPQCACLGSKCMAWEWRITSHTDPTDPGRCDLTNGRTK
jgi:hypothetical protein